MDDEKFAFELNKHCPKCGNHRLILETFFVFCVECEWHGELSDLDDDRKYQVKLRKEKIIKLNEN